MCDDCKKPKPFYRFIGKQVASIEGETSQREERCYINKASGVSLKRMYTKLSLINKIKKNVCPPWFVSETFIGN
jgi:hypothetical protein